METPTNTGDDELSKSVNFEQSDHLVKRINSGPANHLPQRVNYGQSQIGKIKSYKYFAILGGIGNRCRKWLYQ